jgi:predicted ATPase
LKYSTIGAFREYLRKCLRTAGHFQHELAEKMIIDPKVLSRKLRGTNDSRLFDEEVTRIIRILAKWGAINTRAEACHLLELAQLKPDIFSDEEWHTPPLDQLEEGEPQHNLSAPLTRFVGREEQVDRLRALLAQNDTRLVTLVGPGGSGKTRLAQHVASELTTSFAQGVWSVMLASVRDSDLVLQSIMQILYIQSSPDSSPAQSLIAYLRHKKLLLILDNFEQVTDAAKQVGELLAAAPGLKILVTSRAVLRLSGEHEFEVPPLSIPEPDMVVNKENAAQYDAVQLFVERARLVAPNFELTDENAPTIAQICARVDGLPLALELAAARIKLLTPAKLLDWLSRTRLAVLKSEARDVPDRHQTLLKTIQWSYDLLASSAQAWFARLGVFDGGWSLDAVEAMMQALAASPVRDEEDLALSDSALDLLDHLLNNSLLVKPATKDAQGRFIMLETLREYALARLKEHGEIERAQDWHACYYLGLAEEAELGLRGAQQLAWLARLKAEQDNFRAALQWSLAQARSGVSLKMNASGAEISATEVSLRLAAALRPFWEWQGYMIEGRNWLKAALELPSEDRVESTTVAARAKALSALARLYSLQNEQSSSITVAEESIALWHQLDDPAGLAMALFHRAWAPISQGEYELAKSLFEQALQLLSPANDTWLRAQILFLLGDVAGFTGDYELMRSYFTPSKAMFEQIGDRSAIADLLKDQGGMAILEQNYAWALTHLLKSIEMCQELGYKQFLGTGLGLLGFVVGIREEPDAISASIQAAQLWGASNGLLGTIGSNSWISSNPTVQEMIMRILARVHETAWKDAYRRGRSLTVEQAMAAFRESQAAI